MILTETMAILFASKTDPADVWRAALEAEAPDMEVRIWPEVGAVEDIEAVLVWLHEPGDLMRYPNLKLIASLGAGVDQLLCDPALPPGVPITRVVDDGLTHLMSEYVAQHVLRYHRRASEYERLQRAEKWEPLAQPSAPERRVGLMGLGVMGRDVAAKLGALGFRPLGWRRGRGPVAGVETYHGADGLGAFLARCEILVCLLPLTPATQGILDARVFAALPEGAYVVNCARGGHVVEDDLIAALDSGRLGGATLDVFSNEPLPPGHPFWRHPKVTVTPHVAAVTPPRSVAKQTIENIRRLRAGEPLRHEVDLAAGY